MSKIFGIGLPKTGTTSLHRALSILGYSSVHYPMDVANIEQHDAANDMSIALGYRFLDVMYPGSKFILTVRNEGDWLKSCDKYFSAPSSNEWGVRCRMSMFGCSIYNPFCFSKANYNHRFGVEEYFFGGGSESPLLTIDICAGDGWDKLCKFLDKPVPGEPFPHENKTT